MRELKKYVPRVFDPETIESELVKLYRRTVKGDEDAERAANLAVLLVALQTVRTTTVERKAN